MSDTINKARLALIEYKMAIFWFCLFSVNSLCTCIVASLVNCNWSQMDGQAKILFFLTVIANWTGTVMAFVSKQASRIKQTGEIFSSESTATVAMEKTLDGVALATPPTSTVLTKQPSPQTIPTQQTTNQDTKPL